MQTRQIETSSVPAPPLRGLRSLGVDILMHHVFPWLPLKDLVAVAGTNRALASIVEHTRDWGRLYAQAFPNDMAPLPEPLAGTPAPSFARFARRAAGQAFRWGVIEHTFDDPNLGSSADVPLSLDSIPSEIVRHPRAHSDVAICELLEPSIAIDAERVLRNLCIHGKSRVLLHGGATIRSCCHFLCTGEHDVWIQPEHQLIRHRPDNQRLRAVPMVWNAPQVQNRDPVNCMCRPLGWRHRMGGAILGVSPRGVYIEAQSAPSACETIIPASLKLQNGDHTIDMSIFEDRMLFLSSEGRLFAIKCRDFLTSPATLDGLTEPVHRELETNAEVYTLLPERRNLRFKQLVEYFYDFTVLAMQNGHCAVVSGLNVDWVKHYCRNRYALGSSIKGVSKVEGSVLVGLTLDGEVWYIRVSDRGLDSPQSEIFSIGSPSLEGEDFHIIDSGLETFRVPGLNDIVDIRSNPNQWLALDSHGRVFALGSHDNGAAGLGTGASYDYLTRAEMRENDERLPSVSKVEHGPRPLPPEFSCYQFSLLPRRVPLPGHAVSITSSDEAYGALVAPWDAQVKG